MKNQLKLMILIKLTENICLLNIYYQQFKNE